MQENAHVVDLEECCNSEESGRARKMLQHENLLAKIGVDTAENEPDLEI